MMKFNLDDMQNLNVNKTMKYLIFLSFVTQWSFLSMIVNLFTMGIIGIPLFLLMIIDAFTMITFENKTIKRPSYVLSKIWDLIDAITQKRNNGKYNYNNKTTLDIFDNIADVINNTMNKIKNIFNNYNEEKVNNQKYNKERELNKFNDEIGKKITIEYTSRDNKLKKKTFEYKDRASTFINTLEANGYKDYTKYNINASNSLAYIIFNKNKDIVDLHNNKISLSHKDEDYKYVTEGWPKK